jgi:N-carbamoyl-L-amino-acid hydrolase
MLPFARMVLAARAAAERRGVVATVGKVRVRPGNANAVPGHVAAWLDARGPAEDDVRALVAELAELAGGHEVSEESWTPVVGFDPALRDRLARVAGGGGTPAPVLPTGAGHDAGILAAAGVPAGMLFVRNPTGVSHSPEEHAEQADCEAGVVALADVLEDLCR